MGRIFETYSLREVREIYRGTSEANPALLVIRHRSRRKKPPEHTLGNPRLSRSRSVGPAATGIPADPQPDRV